MQCAARGLVAVAGAGGAMLLTIVFFGGWLSHFKLILLHDRVYGKGVDGLEDGRDSARSLSCGRDPH